MSGAEVVERDGRESHITSAAALVLVAAVLAFDGAPWPAFALLAVLGAWYTVMVVPPASRDGGDHDTRALVYLLGAFALQAALVLVSAFAAALLIMLYAHAFWLLRRLWLATVSIGLGTAATGLAVSPHVAGQELANVVVLAASISCFLIGNVVGLLTRRHEEQQRTRALLIDDLRDARAELAGAYQMEGVRVERERMAREIHDTLAQGFTSLILLIQTANTAVDSDPALAHRQLDLAERTARDNLTQARTLVVSGEPGTLGEARIDRVVSRLAGHLSEMADLTCTVGITDLHRELSANEKIVLVRAVQEALANVYRHAGASRVEVTLGADEGGTVLDIVDDGRGFRPGETWGFGLTGMRSRIEEVGGELRITSSPGAGTQVRVIIP
ncbi:sensor histidine kinase [Amycolatopsis magusensis]|uniref:histidine kinase n=1 Tax=Amycolatopsis magusensis TaxID=882444 RepID=A0ABS4PXT7_9PSEU|nr:sensor histidine kinase [Amycolatopsis magusensis]MBP2184234.1 signal transduction histidine kinase [Amycolatopsis magusensis]MDI5982457.1 sensor histidine kinase [Amycolatopsis magusensis]